MNQPVIRSSPDAIDLQWRRRDRVDDAALCCLRRLLRSILAHTRRNLKSFARQVGTYLLPTLPAVSGLPQTIRSEVENVRVNGREDYRLCAKHSEICGAKRSWKNVLRLPRAPIITRGLAT